MGCYKVKDKKKLETPVLRYSNEEEHETSSPEKTQVEPSKIEKTEEKGKTVASSFL
jgi:hypothetical protein